MPPSALAPHDEVDVLVVGGGPAGLFRQLSDRVMLLTHTGPTPDPEQAASLAARDIDLVDGEVVGVEVDDDVLVGVTLAFRAGA